MDPTEFRRAGHLLIDRLADHMAEIEQRPLFPDVTPEALYDTFDEPLPRSGSEMDAVLEEVEEKLLPYIVQVNHPGYFGYITPSAAPAGILGDLIASALNQNVGAFNAGPSATAMERQTVRWLTGLVGFGEGSGGNLVSGGTMANFTGLKLARDRVTGDRAQHEGMTRRLTAYTSDERHVSVDKAADAVGIGRDGLRIIPTDDQFTIRMDELEAAIARDRAAGLLPACIVAMGGSTNTGAVDPLPALRRLADREGMWLHVDAAYGGGMLLSRDFPGLLDGVALADSVTLDPHKWFYAPLDVGAILVRDEGQLSRSFGIRPPYLTDRMDPREERYDYFVHGFEQSKRLRALKVWMSFKRYGADQIGAWVDANVAQARHLYDLVQAHPDFEAAREPRMSTVCLRYTAGKRSEEELGALHATVAREVEQSGRFWIATTALKGKSWLRVNPVNFRTRMEHMDELFALLAELFPRAAG